MRIDAFKKYSVFGWLRLAVGVLIFGYILAGNTHDTLGWPLASVLGVCGGLVVVVAIRHWTALPPFRLVLRLTLVENGDTEDDKLFDTLYTRFKSHRGSDRVFKFDGFDCSDSEAIFYFKGKDGKAVRDAVLALVSDCTFHEGSYFQISENDRQPIPAT